MCVCACVLLYDEMCLMNSSSPVKYIFNRVTTKNLKTIPWLSLTWTQISLKILRICEMFYLEHIINYSIWYDWVVWMITTFFSWKSHFYFKVIVINKKRFSNFLWLFRKTKKCSLATLYFQVFPDFLTLDVGGNPVWQNDTWPRREWVRIILQYIVSGNYYYQSIHPSWSIQLSIHPSMHPHIWLYVYTNWTHQVKNI